jgi:hypothetical protein
VGSLLTYRKGTQQGFQVSAGLHKGIPRKSVVPRDLCKKTKAIARLLRTAQAIVSRFTGRSVISSEGRCTPAGNVSFSKGCSNVMSDLSLVWYSMTLFLVRHILLFPYRLWFYLLFPCSCPRPRTIYTSSAGGDKLHPDDISSGDNHRVPYDDECKISLCQAQVITLMGSKMTGSRIGRPLYMNTFPLSLALFFSHHLRSQYTTSRLPKAFARSLAQWIL